jgi:hypothetical protein
MQLDCAAAESGSSQVNHTEALLLAAAFGNMPPLNID